MKAPWARYLLDMFCAYCTNMLFYLYHYVSVYPSTWPRADLPCGVVYARCVSHIPQQLLTRPWVCLPPDPVSWATARLSLLFMLQTYGLTLPHTAKHAPSPRRLATNANHHRQMQTITTPTEPSRQRPAGSSDQPQAGPSHQPQTGPNARKRLMRPHNLKVIIKSHNKVSVGLRFYNNDT